MADQDTADLIIQDIISLQDMVHEQEKLAEMVSFFSFRYVEKEKNVLEYKHKLANEWKTIVSR
ncbi:hypothetical protein N784_00225 [Pontibacillus litoralis JSM 072002]|uniref:Uncharacterized protein n=1 Tax=Pontibacillus litoralis JSM 072002 TaxID=1385512 RepID=A0A0A5G7R5_9BACI|nr:hypothetical protein N784_00225 [Pontibacillus litoralis JSM 072002]